MQPAKPSKPQRRLMKISRYKPVVVYETVTDDEALLEILWSQRFRFYGQLVLIKRSGRLRVHHWVDEHTRSQEGEDVVVRGHYRLGRTQ